MGISPKDNCSKCETENKKDTSEEWVNETNYPDSIAKIIFDTIPKGKNSKKN